MTRRPSRLPGAVGALLAAAFGLSSAAPGAGAKAADAILSPASPPLEDPGVPPLHEPLPEALGGEGLAIEPEGGPYDWWREAAPGDGTRAFPLRVSVSGQGGESGGHGLLTVWNWHNEAVAQWRIEPGEPRDLSLEVAGRGAYLLTFDAVESGEARRRHIRSLAATQDQREARSRWRDDEFFLGVCAFPGRYHWQAEGGPALPPGLGEAEARALEADLLARAGFGVVRPDVSLEMGLAPEEEGGGYLYDFTRMDAAVDAYTSRGFELALQLMNAGDWAIAARYSGASEPRWPYPREEGHQRAYTRALVGRYGGQARFVQIHNEPDQREFWAGTAEEFVSQYRAMREETRRIDPGLPVVNGGYAFIEEEITPFLVRELKGLSDFQAYHAHGDLAGLKRNFARMRSLHAEAGYEAPVFLNTETGFDAWRLDQERRQGQAVAQRTLYCWAHGHRGILLFCGRMTRGPGREGRDLGLLDYEFGPRFAYAAVSALVTALAGASHEATLLEEEEGIHLYRFRRGGGWILAAFTLGEEDSLVVASDAPQRHHIDEMGNFRPFEDGETSFEIDGYPRYLLFEGGAAAPSAGRPAGDPPG